MNEEKETKQLFIEATNTFYKLQGVLYYALKDINKRLSELEDNGETDDCRQRCYSSELYQKCKHFIAEENECNAEHNEGFEEVETIIYPEEGDEE